MRWSRRFRRLTSRSVSRRCDPGEGVLGSLEVGYRPDSVTRQGLAGGGALKGSGRYGLLRTVRRSQAERIGSGWAPGLGLTWLGTSSYWWRR